MSDAHTAALLSAKGVSRRFVDGKRVVSVLENLDLEMSVGEAVAIVGESGVGKSTLLHVLGALEPPNEGRIEWDGKELASMSGQELASFRNGEIGFVFQLHHLLPDFTAEENVMMPLLVGGFRPEDAARTAREALERVGLEHRLGHQPGELSGGEQQRVAIARAIVREPRALLADEPTGNLDPHTAEGVESLLRELNRSKGMALLVVTHSMRLAASMDRALQLRNGVLEPIAS